MINVTCVWSPLAKGRAEKVHERSSINYSINVNWINDFYTVKHVEFLYAYYLYYILSQQVYFISRLIWSIDQIHETQNQYVLAFGNSIYSSHHKATTLFSFVHDSNKTLKTKYETWIDFLFDKTTDSKINLPSNKTVK